MSTAFLMVSDFCILEINPAWSFYIIQLIHCWIPFTSTIFRSLASIFISEFGLFLKSGFSIK